MCGILYLGIIQLRQLEALGSLRGRQHGDYAVADCYL